MEEKEENCFLDKKLTILLDYMWQASPHNKITIRESVKAKIKQIIKDYKTSIEKEIIDFAGDESMAYALIYKFKDCSKE